jgi:hypothetical protein
MKMGLIDPETGEVCAVFKVSESSIDDVHKALCDKGTFKMPVSVWIEYLPMPKAKPAIVCINPKIRQHLCYTWATKLRDLQHRDVRCDRPTLDYKFNI